MAWLLCLIHRGCEDSSGAEASVGGSTILT